MKCRRLVTWKDEQGVEHKDVVWFGSKGYTIAPIRDDLTFANATWDEIAFVCALGKHKDYFNVGDTKPIKLFCNNIEFESNLIIIDFDHDKLSNGNGYACMTVTFDEAITVTDSSYYRYDTSVTSANSWKETAVRVNQAPLMLDAILAKNQSLRSALVEVNKYSCTNAFSADDIVETSDTLFLMSAFEVDVSRTANVFVKEGSTYEYFKTNGAAKRTVAARTMNPSGYSPQGPSSLRSHASGSGVYMYVKNGETIANTASSANYGRWAFCIGEVGKNIEGLKRTNFFNPDDKHDNYSDKQQSVADSLTQRLSVIRRELWYDVNFGLPLLDKQKSKVAIDAFIGKTVLAHPDVDSIQDFDSKIINKVYTCSMKIITKYGEIILNV